MTVRLLVGDVFDRLRSLPANSFDVVLTSPPYWGLRDYDVEGQIGIERTLGEHIDVIVRVFREIRRVLKSQGIAWMNYGDCYAAAPNGKSAAKYKAEGNDDRSFRDKPFSTIGPVHPTVGEEFDRSKREASRHGGGNNPGGAIFDPNYARTPREHFVASDRQSRIETGGRIVAGGYLKSKDLCMIPNRLAIALQDDGWWVRSEIIWHKRNPMPESVYDRPTTAHEKVFMLTKGEDYYYNWEAAREETTGGAHRRAPRKNSRESVDHTPVSKKKVKVPGGWDVGKGSHGTIINCAGRTEATYRDLPGVTPKSAPEDSNIKAKGSFHASTTELVETRNMRNVWSIASQAFKEAHFATFPRELVRRCLLPSPKDVCGFCGRASDCGALCSHYGRARTKVLDPFGGAGTTALVAESMSFDCTLIELKPEYAEIVRKRLTEAGAEIVA